ncbi:MAG: VWA domain-containing protein [Clostridium sp.]|nr:VWA domain-containing protein [Prevotella sp.]MCM1428185.1 VWA domain-containing protein [Clostridium sp.]MCM1475916.1 VWA domain-containing protein [Muribaculaceae bacterium]
MITFAYPHLLWLLLAVPLIVLIFIWTRWRRAAKIAEFGNSTDFARLAPDVSPYKPAIKLTLRLIALTAIILAVCRPWGGVSSQNTTRQGIEVYLAVDASNSMYASSNDNPEGIDRMRMAKIALEKLIDNLGSDRVGLIVYAGEAYTLIPSTNDYVSAKMFLNSIDPSMIQNQGTDMAAAVNLALNSFSKDKNIGKAIVLLTDADELENESEVKEAVQKAAKQKVQVDVIGVGGTKPMQIYDPKSGYVYDPDTGKPAESALNEDLAVEIAKLGKGIYVNASNKNAIGELDKKLGQLQKASLESSFLTVHDELYIIFVWIALVAIIADVFVLDRKIRWLDRFTFFKKDSAK